MHSANIPEWRYVWLIVASTLAGVMNALAGGGSFISFPAMLGIGVLPVQANATNTVALWPGQVTSLLTLRKDVPRDLMPTVVLMSLIGGIAGAETLLHTAQVTFMHLVPWLMLGGAALFGVSGYLSRWVRGRVENPHHGQSISKFWLALSLFPVCFYIGYFGAGGGFLTMTILALFGMEDMHKLNALKVVSQVSSNFFALITFILTGNVVWHACVVAMIFAGIGGWIGARTARRLSASWLRGFVVVIGVVIAAYFFWRQG